MKMFLALVILYYYLLSFHLPTTLAEQCGWQAGGAACPGGLCCSQWGWCGTTDEYCGHGCQSNCRSQPSIDDLSHLLSKQTFDEMLLHRNDSPNCAVGFYTYDAFITAAKSFPSFGNTGSTEIRKRELAAFFGQTSHETTGGRPYAPDGPYTWGYCFKEETYDKSPHCVPSSHWPCVPGKKYYGRGPFLIAYNYNYGPAREAIGHDLLNDPDEVANDAETSFETALWYWMTPQSPKPSAHQLMTDQWSPSWADIRAGRYPGYGVVTNIINGELECGRGYDHRVADRIGFYKRYADILGVSYGNNLDCYHQRPFGGYSVNEL